MVAAAGGLVIPVGVLWPAHRAVSRLPLSARRELEASFGPLGLGPDALMGTRVDAVDRSWWAHSGAPAWEVAGSGLLARLSPGPAHLALWAPVLMRLPAPAVAALRQAGNRWAALSATVLKNLDTAAASWAETTAGDSAPPTDRQPALALLR